MVSYDGLGPEGRVVLHAQTLFVENDVKRLLLKVGKLTKSGAEVKFGSKGSWIGLHTDHGKQRVLVRVKGKTLGLSIQKDNVWSILETDDAAPNVELVQMRRSAEEKHPTHRQRQKLRRYRGQKILKGCGLSEKPVTLR